MNLLEAVENYPYLKEFFDPTTQKIDFQRSNNEGNKVIHIASHKGDVDVLRYLTEELKVNLNDEAENKSKPIHIDPKVIHAKANNGREAIHFAAENGQLEVIKFLISIDSKVIHAKANNGREAIHFAAENGHVEALEFLISQGASIDVKDVNGMDPTHWAAINGHVEVIKFLMSKGASINNTDSYGREPIHCAAENGHVEVIKFLISQDDTVVDKKNCEGNTPLHLAVLEEKLEAIISLLEHKANVEAKNRMGLTPLDVAASKSSFNIYSLLIDIGSNPFPIPSSSVTDITLFRYFKHANNPERIEEIKTILASKTDFAAVKIFLRECEDKSNLFEVKELNAEGQGKGLLKYLLKNLLIKHKDHENDFLKDQLLKAIENKKVNLVLKLLDYLEEFAQDKAETSITYIDRETPLTFALTLQIENEKKVKSIYNPKFSKYIKMVEALAKKGLVNTPNQDGIYPLQIAVSDNNYELTEFLLNLDADSNLALSYHHKPINLAFIQDNAAIFDLLKNKGADLKTIEQRWQNYEGVWEAILKMRLKNIENYFKEFDIFVDGQLQNDSTSENIALKSNSQTQNMELDKSFQDFSAQESTANNYYDSNMMQEVIEINSSKRKHDIEISTDESPIKRAKTEDNAEIFETVSAAIALIKYDNPLLNQQELVEEMVKFGSKGIDLLLELGKSIPLAEEIIENTRELGAKKVSCLLMGVELEPRQEILRLKHSPKEADAMLIDLDVIELGLETIVDRAENGNKQSQNNLDFLGSIYSQIKFMLSLNINDLFSENINNLIEQFINTLGLINGSSRLPLPYFPHNPGPGDDGYGGSGGDGLAFYYPNHRNYEAENNDITNVILYLGTNTTYFENI